MGIHIRCFIRSGKNILLALFCLALAGCAVDAENRQEGNALKESEESASEIGDSTEEERHTLIPMEAQWQDMTYDPEDTIYYKTYYDDFVRGKIRHIEYPDIDIRDDMEDYFLYEDDFERWDNLVEMFYDYRTVEMQEEELKVLFYQHGYALCLQGAEMEDLHVRFVEITEIDGLTLYPTRILIQTWYFRFGSTLSS